MVLSYVFQRPSYRGNLWQTTTRFPWRVSSQLFQGLNFVNDLQPTGWTKAICFVEAWMCMEDPVDEVVPPGVPMRWIGGDFCWEVDANENTHLAWDFSLKDHFSTRNIWIWELKKKLLDTHGHIVDQPCIDCDGRCFGFFTVLSIVVETFFSCICFCTINIFF